MKLSDLIKTLDRALTKNKAVISTQQKIRNYILNTIRDVKKRNKK
jgi:hypothetical protein